MQESALPGCRILDLTGEAGGQPVRITLPPAPALAQQ